MNFYKFTRVSSQVLLLFLFSCEPILWFEEPQPKGISNASSFNEDFLGTYQSIRDSSLLIVEPYSISLKSFIRTKTPTSGVFIDRDNIVASDSLIISAFEEEGGSAFIKDDTVYAKYLFENKLFELSDYNIIRLYKQHYYLNHYISEGVWSVKRVGFNASNHLIFSELQVPKDLDSFKNITPLKEQKTSKGKVYAYIVKPEIDELKQLLDRANFSTQTYIRIDTTLNLEQ